MKIPPQILRPWIILHILNHNSFCEGFTQIWPRIGATNKNSVDFDWCESQYHRGIAVFRHNEAYMSDTHRQLKIIRMQIEGEKYYNKLILVFESVLRSEKTQYYFIIGYQCEQSIIQQVVVVPYTFIL